MTKKQPLITLNKAFALLLLLYLVMEFYPVAMQFNDILRALVGLAGLVYVFIFPKRPLITRDNALALTFLGLWLVYSLFSFAWALDSKSVLEHCLHVSRYLLVFILFEGLFRHPAIREIGRAHV